MIHNIDECLIVPNNRCLPLNLTRCNGVELDIFSSKQFKPFFTKKIIIFVVKSNKLQKSVRIKMKLKLSQRFHTQT